jgi:hypothetical protein
MAILVVLQIVAAALSLAHASLGIAVLVWRIKMSRDSKREP